MSLIHCGIGPGFLSKFLFNNIIQNETIIAKLEDITSVEISEEIVQVMGCEKEEEFWNVIIEGCYFKLAGWENTMNFNKKEQIINGNYLFILLKYFVVSLFFNRYNKILRHRVQKAMR